MIEVGRLCLKTAGRDAGGKCVVVDILDGNFVLIDGETRRRKCNILHLEPLGEVLKIKKGASHEDVAEALKEKGIEVRSTKPKEKTERPKRIRKKKVVEEEKGKDKKKAKKEERKEAKKKAKEEKVKTEKPKEKEAKDKKAEEK